MAFSRITNVSGISKIDGLDININFNYENTSSPTTVNFSFITLDGASVHGSCNEIKIINYYVNEGIVSDGLLTLVETECKRVLTNYETV